MSKTIFRAAKSREQIVRFFQIFLWVILKRIQGNLRKPDKNPIGSFFVVVSSKSKVLEISRFSEAMATRVAVESCWASCETTGTIFLKICARISFSVPSKTPKFYQNRRNRFCWATLSPLARYTKSSPASALHPAYLHNPRVQATTSRRENLGITNFNYLCHSR